MKTIKSTIIILLIATSLLTVNSFATEKQKQKSKDFRQKISQIKKIQMLDELDLSEEQSEKFLLLYNNWNKQIEVARSKVDSARRELKKFLKDTTASYSASQYSQKTDNFLTCLNSMQNLIEKRNASIKSSFPGEIYARYILFEEDFMVNLQKKYMRNARLYDDQNCSPKMEPNKPPLMDQKSGKRNGGIDNDPFEQPEED